MRELIKNIVSVTGNLLFFFKKKEINKKEIKKILIVSLYFRGDVLFSTPVIKFLKNIFPNSLIDIMVKSRSKEVIEGNPNINKLLIFDDIKTADYNDSTGFKLNKKISILNVIRKENYDLCIDLTGKYSTALIALLGKFKYSIGLNYNGFGFAYSKFINSDTQNTKGHLTEKYLNIVKEGLNIDKIKWNELNRELIRKCDLFLNDEELEIAEIKLKTLLINFDRPLVCIQVTAGWKAKEWSESAYSQLIGKLIESDYSFVLIGSEGDKEINYRILDKVSVNLRKFNLSLPLKINAAVIKLSDVFIGSDSIGLHIAGAVDTPSIGIFGPTNPAFSSPAGDMHRVIYKKLYCSSAEDKQYCTRNAGKTCTSIDCITGISPEEVFANVEYLLEKNYHHKRITA